MWYSALVKKSRLLCLLILPLLSTCLSGCAIFDLFGSSETPIQSGSGKISRGDFDAKGLGYYRARGEQTLTPFSYRDVNFSCGMDCVSSSGQVKLLCVPVELSDYPFYGGTKSPYLNEEAMRQDLDIAFNGEAEDTNYWESLASFYKTSSYGKLDISVEIGDIYRTGETVRQFREKDQNVVDEEGQPVEAPHVVETLNNIVEDIRQKKGNDYVKRFDTNSDGWVDGIVMIYSCPDYQSDTYIGNTIDTSGQTYWAFCYWAAESYGKASNPTGNLFFWASHSFLHEAARYPKVDCHTFIHEFGHMLGLDDYYPMTSTPNAWNAAGGLLMMDENILDHDLFSKTALGWTEPYVVTGKKTVALTINPSQQSGDCIIIPARSSWNQTAFAEYLILDLYTPYGLNELDSTVAYAGKRELGYSTFGVRLYHVDARLVSISYSSQKWTYYYGDSLNKTDYFQVAASNCIKDESRCRKDFSLLSLIDAQNKKSFRGGDIADNGCLFQTGDVFNFQSYRAYFPNDKKWNDGSDASNLQIFFTSVSAESAKIEFRF